MARKNAERDTTAGVAFTTWKNFNNLSDGQIAKVVGKSAAAIATWRNGTRPMTREREVLQTLTGWYWDDPPGADYVPAKSNFKKAPRKAVVRRPGPDSIEALLIAADVLGSAMDAKRTLDPQRRPNDAITWRVVASLVKLEVTRREVEIAQHQKVAEFRNLVLGHNDPKEALRFLREHLNIDANILSSIEQSLATKKIAVA